VRGAAPKRLTANRPGDRPKEPTMPTLRFRHPRLPVSLLFGLAAATLTGAALADELPTFRKGTWEFQRTVDGGPGKSQKLSNRECVDPTADMKRQNAMLTKMGCTFSPVAKSGNAYTFTSQCKMQGIVAQSKTVLTYESDGAYRLNVESTQNGRPSKETLTAKRVGDC
jgi:hypothetical protein